MTNIISLIAVVAIIAYQIYGEVVHRKEWNRLMEKERAYAKQREQNKR